MNLDSMVNSLERHLKKRFWKDTKKSEFSK